MLSTDWQENAKCTKPGADPDDWDVDRYETRKGRIRASEKVCQGCPVMSACARDTAAHGDLGTIRAGAYIPQAMRTDDKKTLGRLMFAYRYNRRPSNAELREYISVTEIPLWTIRGVDLREYV